MFSKALYQSWYSLSLLVLFQKTMIGTALCFYIWARALSSLNAPYCEFIFGWSFLNVSDRFWHDYKHT